MNVIKALKRVFKMPTLTIRLRLLGVVGMLCIMLVIGAVVGLTGIQQSNEASRKIYEGQLVPLSVSDQIARDSLHNFISLGEATYHLKQKSIVA
jgi:hypothetical protein